MNKFYRWRYFNFLRGNVGQIGAENGIFGYQCCKRKAAAIGRTCGGKIDGLPLRVGKTVFRIQSGSLFPCGENLADRGLRQETADIMDHRILDAGILRALDLAGVQDIPERDVMGM